jgi:hypothetical protein
MRYASIGMVAIALCGVAALAAGDEKKVSVKSTPPVVVKTEPQAGRADVDPAETTEIQITFSKEMADGNWAFVQTSKDTYPKTTGKPRYLDDHRTCVLPVQLEPGKTYVVWLNKAPFDSFTDTDGHKAVPYLLVFETKP